MELDLFGESDMPKIALCYSGRPRDLVECYENHKKYFGLGQEDVDVFAHLWFDESLSGTPYLPNGGQGVWPDESIKSWISQNWNPKKIVFEKPKIFENLFVGQWEQNRGWHSAGHKDSMLSSLYSLQEAVKLKKEYEIENNFKYDYVVRLRPDMVGLKSFGKIEEYDKEHLHVWFSIPGEDCLSTNIQDYAFVEGPTIGESEVMDKFSLTYSNVQKLLDSGCHTFTIDALLGFNAVKLYNLKLKRHNWKWKYFYLPYFYGIDGNCSYSCGPGISGEE